MPYTKIHCVVYLEESFFHFDSRVKSIVAPYGSSADVELQQRAAEFSHLFGSYAELRSGLLERMPLVGKYPV